MHSSWVPCHVESEASARKPGIAKLREQSQVWGYGRLDDGVFKRKKCVSAMTGLKVLSLSNNQIDAKGCEYLAPALKAMTGLVKLDLSGNQIDANACEHLAPAFKAMTGLSTLYLSNNQIDAKACEQLAPALKAMTGLKQLVLQNNNIPKGSKAKAGGMFRSSRKATGKELMKTAWKEARKDSNYLYL